MNKVLKPKVCDNCGKDFMGKTNCKYCSDKCRKEAWREKAQIQKALHEKQAVKRKKRLSSLAEVNEDARAMGISYGQYTELLRQEANRPAEEARKEELRKMFKRKGE